MLNVVAMLWQRRRPTSPQLSFLAAPQRCDNVNLNLIFWPYQKEIWVRKFMMKMKSWR